MCSLRDSAYRPVCSVLRFRLEGLPNQRRDHLVGYASRAHGPQFVVQSLDFLLEIASAPKAHRLLGHEPGCGGAMTSRKGAPLTFIIKIKEK